MDARRLTIVAFLGFLLGTLIGPEGAAWRGPLLGAVLATAIGLLFRRRRLIVLASLLVASNFLGMAASSRRIESLEARAAALEGRPLIGEVIDEGERRARARDLLVDIGGGRIRATVFGEGGEVGSEIRLEGEFVRGKRHHLARGILGFVKASSFNVKEPAPARLRTIRRGLIASRKRVLAALSAALPEPQASFLAGLLLGERSLPAPLLEAARKTGTSHLIALSGYNLTLLAALFTVILAVPLAFLPKLVRFVPLATIAALWLFVALVGAPASGVRAAIMATIFLLARFLGRPSAALPALIIAAGAMAAANPLLSRFDLAFQLSVLATAGLVLFGRPFEERLAWLPAGTAKVLAPTLAALAAVTPLLWHTFGRLSLIAPLTNLAVVPLVPFASGFGIFILALSMLSPALAESLGLPLSFILGGILDVIEQAARLPFAELVTFQFPGPAMAAAYTFLLWLAYRWNREVFRL